MRVLVVDNYDSFTYNLVQCLGTLGAVPKVVRNSTLSAEEIIALAPDRILISPGPGGPDDAGVSREVIRQAAGRVPLLGVCLGHQCLAEVFGGRIVRAHPVHGKTSMIRHDGFGVFLNVPKAIEVARYHSLVVEPCSVSDDFTVSAWTDDGIVMGLRHKQFSMAGIQFHPESFMTQHGMRILENFLKNGGRS